MAAIIIEGAEGLLTGEKHIDSGRKGYLIASDNVFVRKEGVIEPRPGLSAIGATNSNITRMFYDQINSQTLRAGATANLLQKWDGAAWTDLDTTRKYSAIAPSRSFAFLMSNEGLRRINAANTATEIGYVPEALDIQLANIGSSGFLPNNSAIGYRVVFGISNSNNQFFLGAPSGRAVFVNTTGATCNIQCTFTVPAGLTTSHFYQVYRTQPSGGATIDPYDDSYLVYEAYLTSSDLSAGTVALNDSLLTGQGGAALYTNQGQQSSLQTNFPCECTTGTYGTGSLELFADCLFASNDQPRSNLNLFLLGINTAATTNNNQNGLSAFTFSGTTSNTVSTISTISATVISFLRVGMIVAGTGIQAGTKITSVGVSSVGISLPATATGAPTVTAGDVITLAGVDYIAWTSESIANRQFLVSNNTIASIALRLTCESLIRVVNRYSGNTTMYLRYLSSANELPGHMYLFARTDRASSYTIQCTRAAAFSPNIAAATTIPSIGVPGRVRYSKVSEPEAWPTLNYFDMPGSATVIALKALQSALLVFTNRGVYRIVGVYGNFGLELLDASSILATTASNIGSGVVVVNNVAFALMTKGLTAVTESVARRVEHCPDALVNPVVTLNQLSAHTGDSTVFVPTNFGTYVYHTDWGVWLSWSTTYSSGVYNQADALMYLTSGTQSYQTRDSQYSAASYYDSNASVTINSISGLDVTLASAPAGWLAGDLLIQGANTHVITAINSNVATVDSVTGFTTGAATVRIGYTSSVIYCPTGIPDGMQDGLMTCDFMFDGADLSPTSLATFNNTGYLKIVSGNFYTDQDQAVASSPGQVTSGNFPFLYRAYLPASARRCNNIAVGLSWRTCANKTRFTGLMLFYKNKDSRSTRNV